VVCERRNGVKVVEVPETVSVIETHDPSRSYVKEAI